MEDNEFRAMIAQVIGAVVYEPEITKLAGEGTILAFGASDADINWYIDLTATPVFSEGIPERRDVRITMDKDDWIRSLRGELSATQAMLRKRLKVEGAMMAAMKLPMPALLRVYEREIGAPA